MTPSTAAAVEADNSPARDQRKAAQLLAETVVGLGAAMVTAAPTFQCYPLGHIAWLGDRHLFWFEADSEAADAGHRLEYDDLCRVVDRGVVFFREDRIVGYICTLATAAIREASALRDVHRIWSNVSPAVQTAVCESCERLDEGFGARTCLWHLPRCAHTRAPDQSGTTF